MGNGYVTNPLGFLVSTLFGLYILMVMLRFLMGWVRADFYNPISQFLVRLTNPVLAPLRQVIPPAGRVDMATVLLLLLLQMLELLILSWLKGAHVPFIGLLVWALAELLSLALNVFLFSILIQVILSWVSPGTYNSVSSILYSLNEPLLTPVRKFLPPMGGIDLSPLVVIIGIQVLKMLLIPPLLHLV
jgi:YggT family protein